VAASSARSNVNMSMKVSFLQILNAVTLLRRIQSTAKMEHADSLSVRRLGLALDQELRLFSEERVPLERLVKKDENGQLVEVNGEYQFDSEENRQAYFDGLVPLLNCEVEIDANPIDLAKMKGFLITPDEIGVLEPFLVP
jgi:hypothetical protein